MNYINTLLVTPPNVALIPFKKKKESYEGTFYKSTFPFPPPSLPVLDY